MIKSSPFSFIVVRTIFIMGVLIAIIGFLYTPFLVYFFNKEKSITLLAWPQEIDASEFALFEKETGIKVYVRYFENNEELAAKLLSTKGGGVDVVMPTDYAADLFIKKGLLKKIDKNKINFIHYLKPQLMGHYFDPGNDYTIPYYWGVYGIGFDKDFWAGRESLLSWSILFDKQSKDARIAIPDNARYLVLLVARYLFGTIDNLDINQLNIIKKYLIKQKPLVELYTESHGEYLLASKASALVVLLSADVAKVMKYFSHVDFKVPEQGSFLLIDSFALSAHTQKDALVYQFLNYLYRADVLKKYVDKFTFFPATTHVQPAFIPDQFKTLLDIPRHKIDFFRNVVSSSSLSDIWVSLKS